jgi:hypothetical protein
VLVPFYEVQADTPAVSAAVAPARQQQHVTEIHAASGEVGSGSSELLLPSAESVVSDSNIGRSSDSLHRPTGIHPGLLTDPDSGTWHTPAAAASSRPTAAAAAAAAAAAGGGDGTGLIGAGSSSSGSAVGEGSGAEVGSGSSELLLPGAESDAVVSDSSIGRSSDSLHRPTGIHPGLLTEPHSSVWHTPAAAASSSPTAAAAAGVETGLFKAGSSSGGLAVDGGGAAGEAAEEGAGASSGIGGGVGGLLSSVKQALSRPRAAMQVRGRGLLEGARCNFGLC